MVFFIAISQKRTDDILEFDTTLLQTAQKCLVKQFKRFDDPRQYFRMYRVGQKGLTEVGIMGRLKGGLYWRDSDNCTAYYPMKKDGTPNRRKPRTAGL